MQPSFLRRSRAFIVVVAAVAAAVVFFVILAFYIKPPAAVRTVARTGAIDFTIPSDSEVSTRLSWPISRAVICPPVPEKFTVDATSVVPACSLGGDTISGSLWFEPSVRVQLSSLGAAGVEILLTRRPEAGSRKVGALRTLTGDQIEIMSPARLLLEQPDLSSKPPLVVPILGQTLLLGQESSWQALTSSRIVQSGNVFLVRESLFGDVLFLSDETPLLLGDWVRLESRNEYIQGIAQLGGGASFDVALSISEGDAWLHRIARDPVHLDTPLAAQLFRDPMVAILAVLASFAVGVWLSILGIRGGRK